MIFQRKVVPAISLLAFCCILISCVTGMPNVVDSEVQDIALNRTKREECVDWYGCHKGRCWTGCTALGLKGEWCYTGDDDGHLYCNDKSQCNGCLSCVGACTVTDWQF